MIEVFGGLNDTSRSFLSRTLQRTGRFSALPSISYTEHGKPFFPEHPNLHFSLSHSGPYILCALDCHPLGVDIEIIKPRQNKLPTYALTTEEYSRYLALGGDWAAFYSIWTQKEAWSKYTGFGLGITLHQTSPKNNLYFKTYAGSDWTATVCGESIPPTDIVWIDH